MTKTLFSKCVRYKGFHSLYREVTFVVRLFWTHANCDIKTRSQMCPKHCFPNVSVIIYTVNLHNNTRPACYLVTYNLPVHRVWSILRRRGWSIATLPLVTCWSIPPVVWRSLTLVWRGLSMWESPTTRHREGRWVQGSWTSSRGHEPAAGGHEPAAQLLDFVFSNYYRSFQFWLKTKLTGPKLATEKHSIFRRNKLCLFLNTLCDRSPLELQNIYIYRFRNCSLFTQISS